MRLILEKNVWVPVLFIVLFSYFSYHLFQGDRGYFAMRRLDAELTEKKASLDGLKRQKQDLERSVMLLSPQSLDQDILEEQARRLLNLVHPRDLIIYLDK